MIDIFYHALKPEQYSYQALRHLAIMEKLRHIGRRRHKETGDQPFLYHFGQRGWNFSNVTQNLVYGAEDNASLADTVIPENQVA